MRFRVITPRCRSQKTVPCPRPPVERYSFFPLFGSGVLGRRVVTESGSTPPPSWNEGSVHLLDRDGDSTISGGPGPVPQSGCSEQSSESLVWQSSVKRLEVPRSLVVPDTTLYLTCLVTRSVGRGFGGGQIGGPDRETFASGDSHPSSRHNLCSPSSSTVKGEGGTEHSRGWEDHDWLQGSEKVRKGEVVIATRGTGYDEREIYYLCILPSKNGKVHKIHINFFQCPLEIFHQEIRRTLIKNTH